MTWIISKPISAEESDTPQVAVAGTASIIPHIPMGPRGERVTC